MRGRCQTQHVSTQAPTERAAGVGRARGSCRHRREGGKAARRARARRWAYAQEGWAPIAALAPRVLALSRTDSVAQSIVAAAVKQAGVALAAVVGKCGLQGAFPIVLSGARPRNLRIPCRWRAHHAGPHLEVGQSLGRGAPGLLGRGSDPDVPSAAPR